MRMFSLTLLLTLLSTCGPATGTSEKAGVPVAGISDPWLNPEGRTIATRFPPPPGFQRVAYQPHEFGGFLQNQPLKPHGTPVKLYNGDLKANQYAHAAVLDVDVEARDLQQCADAVMRLRAEYLYDARRYDEIHFNFVSGFRADYRRWRAGERIRVQGNHADWKPGEGATPGYKVFRKYLTMVFSYAGTASLVHELRPKEITAIAAGDVLIRGGSPGHAVIVVDKATNTAGETVVLLAQSYMPAQNIHVLINPLATDGSPWYRVRDFGETIRTAEYTFYEGALRAW